MFGWPGDIDGAGNDPKVSGRINATQRLRQNTLSVVGYFDAALPEIAMVMRLTTSRTQHTFRVALCLASLIFAAWPSRGQELKGASSILAAKIAESGRKRVAVVDFTDLQGNVTE